MVVFNLCCQEDHLPAGDLPAPVENAPEEGVSPMVGAAILNAGGDHVEIAPKNGMIPMDLGGAPTTTTGAGDQDKNAMVDLEDDHMDKTPTIEPTPIANVLQTPMTKEMTNGDDQVDQPGESTDEMLRAPTRRLDSFAEPADDGADVASDMATCDSEDARKLLSLQQPEKPLQRRDQLGSDFRATRQRKAKAKGKAKAKPSPKSKASQAKTKAKAKAKSSPKSKAKKSNSGKEKQETKAENKSKDKEAKRSKKDKPEKGGDPDEVGCKKRAKGVGTFAGRYPPSDGVMRLRFDAMKDIFQSRIGHLLARQSSFQDKGWDNGGGAYKTIWKRHQNMNHVTMLPMFCLW